MTDSITVETGTPLSTAGQLAPDGLPRDIVFASLVDWGRMPYWRWRSMFRAAVSNGHRVLWVDHFSIGGSLRAIARDPRRVITRVVEADPGLYLSSSPLRVSRGGARPRRIGAALAVAGIARTAERLGFDRPLLWIAGPAGRRLIGQVGERATVYDCSDDLSRLGVPASMLEEESRLVEQADLVVACSTALEESKRGLGAPVCTVTNGVDPDLFAEATRPGHVLPAAAVLRKPVIGYHGVIYDRIDWPLVEAVARAEPGWSFAFLGSVRAPIPAAVTSLTNVHFLPQLEFEEVPFFYRGCDACWVPHIVNDLTARQSSLKTLEYLAAGRPTVLTAVPLDAAVAAVVSTGTGTAGIVAALRHELGDGSTHRLVDRLAVARANSWQARFGEVAIQIREVVR